MVIRGETSADRPATEALALTAFAPDTRVAELVRKLRASPSLISELNLVAEEDGVVVGHVMFSRAKLDSGHEVAMLSPLGVMPDYQRQNIGSFLTNHALEYLHAFDFPLVVVEGVPSYYPRFGIVRASPLGVYPQHEIPDEACMAYKLPKYRDRVRGEVVYPEAFDFLYDEALG